MNRHQNTAQKQKARGAAQSRQVPGKMESYLGRAQQFLQEFFNRAGKPVDTMFRVAQERYYAGEYADAASRLRLVTKFQPENALAWYLLGSSDLAEGNPSLAGISFRKSLSLNPQHEESRFLLAVVDPSLPENEHPKFAPLTLAVEHFDGAALYYDEENLDALGYSGHEEAYKALQPFINPGLSRFKVVDLGCGTGLAALQFRDMAGQVEGVDISQNMLAQADLRRDEKERRVYDVLHRIDLRRYLIDQTPDSCDVIIAANVFPYLGGLTPVFDGLAHALKRGGVVSFSVEPMQGNDFGLIPGEGRFAHSEAYIVEQAKRVGLEVLAVSPFEMFAGAEGVQYVLRKPDPNAPRQQPAAPTGQAPQQQGGTVPPAASSSAMPSAAPQPAAPSAAPYGAAPQGQGEGVPPKDNG